MKIRTLSSLKYILNLRKGSPVQSPLNICKFNIENVIIRGWVLKFFKEIVLGISEFSYTRDQSINVFLSNILL